MTTPPGFPDSIENRLVLLCARKELDEAQITLLRQLIGQSVDWRTVLRFSAAQGLTLLVQRHLKPEQKSIPEDVWKLLQNNARAALMRNLQLAAELKRAMRSIQDQGITALAYKGPAQAQAAYGSLDLRSFQDLDVLVRPTDLEGVRQALQNCDYAPKFAPGENATQLGITPHEETFVPVNGRGNIDLHWDFSVGYFPFPMTIGEVWERKVPSEVGSGIYTLCPEDMLLSIAFHSGKHLWGRLEWVSSFHEILLVNGDNLNWEQFKARAESGGNYRVTALALRLAIDLHNFGGSSNRLALPQWAQQWAEEPAVAKLAADMWRGFARGGVKDTDFWHCLPYLVKVLDIKANRGKALRAYLTRILAPGENEMNVLTLPRPLYFLYFFIRPVQLIGKVLSAKLSRRQM